MIKAPSIFCVKIFACAPLKIRFIFGILFLTGFASGIFFLPAVYAGTLSCLVRASACNSGEVNILKMKNTANSHAGLPTSSYTSLVCCTGVAGLGNSCASGTNAVVLKLSGAANAHVRQGALADYPSATNVCISVPSGGSVSVGYQSMNCAGFDTTIGSMTSTTNSHIGDGDWINGAIKICATAAGTGALSVDIVDADGNPVADPAIAMGAAEFSPAYQTINGVFDASAQKIRVANTTFITQWTLDIAATGGPASFWDGSPADYDFNDPTAEAEDGGDADNMGGQMTIDASVGGITPKLGCDNTGISLGLPDSFNEEEGRDSINLLVAGASAGTDCYWDAAGIVISQTIPREQPAASDYSIDMTLTITAI